jgi:hypothetical protein
MMGSHRQVIHDSEPEALAGVHGTASVEEVHDDTAGHAVAAHSLKRQRWLTNLKRVSCFIDEHGHFPRQRDLDADGHQVGKWVAKQKARWESLDTNQRVALEALPGFALKARDADWNRMCDLAAEARDAGFVLQHRLMYKGEPIGQWYRDLWRGRHVMTSERRERLERHGL